MGMESTANTPTMTTEEARARVQAFVFVAAEIQRIDTKVPAGSWGPPKLAGAQQLLRFERIDGMPPSNLDLDAFRATSQEGDVVCRIGLHVVVNTYSKVGPV